MKIDTLVLGLYENNCYVVRKDDKAHDCLVIDTALDVAGLIDFLTQNDLTPAAVVLTHGHADHIAGIADILDRWPDCRVCIHRDDAAMLESSKKNLSALAGKTITAPKPDLEFDDGAVIAFAGIKLDVLHTPGHTPGGVCFYSSSEGVLFCGDTVFAGSVGRSDFEYADGEQLIASIRQKVLTLPETTRLYPGHGPATTVRNEKRHNPYLQ